MTESDNVGVTITQHRRTKQLCHTFTTNIAVDM